MKMCSSLEREREREGNRERGGWRERGIDRRPVRNLQVFVRIETGDSVT